MGHYFLGAWRHQAAYRYTYYHHTRQQTTILPALTKSFAPSGEMGSPAVHMLIALRFTNTPSSTSTTTPSFRNCSIIETGQLPSDPVGSGMVSV